MGEVRREGDEVEGMDNQSRRDRDGTQEEGRSLGIKRNESG